MNKEEEIKQILLELIQEDSFKEEMKNVIMETLEQEIGDMVSFKQYVEDNIFNN